MKLAWRNLLRNKRRSFIAGTAIGIGLAALIFVDALLLGMERNMIDSATASFLGQGRIQRTGFQDTQQADLTIGSLEKVLEGLRQEPILRHFTPRVLTYSMVSSPSNLSSIELVGIDPVTEKPVSEIDEAIVKGDYFSGDNDRDILIGDRLAEILKVSLGDRLVVTVSQAETGDLSQDLFRVSGIFRLNITEMDRGMAFVRLKKAQAMLGIGNDVHEIALVFADSKSGGDAGLPFWRKYSRFGNEAMGWPDIMPQLEAVFKLSRFSTYLAGLMLFGVVALGIINTLFMSLHERMFEFGVLRAVGTRPFSILQLVTYEAGSLAVLSIVLGGILGFVVTYIVAQTGIDYTGIEYSGVTFRKLIYPVLHIRQFIEYPLWLFLFTMLVGLYPASYAARMSPAAAMRRSL
ncbi:MAG: ABC transporter permease [Acidobacteria bacterium]|nr:ABC transporter permease [Acidobacteriota bacterium]